ncbi:hypothetical protein [Aquamicrobium soli]|uniref:Lipoprotein n=1 Tax=Aquamicrobium soli TaxID=1811518 RepID=A0ABV7KBF1_9HYPH
MRALAIVAVLFTLAGCSTTGVGNAYTDYKRTSFEVGVNHCLHNTVLQCGM